MWSALDQRKEYLLDESSRNKKAHLHSSIYSELRWAKAEEEGFEPPVPLGTLVFKTSAFNRSAIPPVELDLPHKMTKHFSFFCGAAAKIAIVLNFQNHF